jgi:hypothetical protein
LGDDQSSKEAVVGNDERQEQETEVGDGSSQVFGQGSQWISKVMPQKLISDAERIWVRLAVYEYAAKTPDVIVAKLRVAVLERADVPKAVEKLDYGQFYALLQGVMRRMVRDKRFEVEAGNGVHRKGVKIFRLVNPPEEILLRKLKLMAVR